MLVNDSAPGCIISISGTDIEVEADANGYFILQVPAGNKPIDVELSFAGCPIFVISSILPNKSRSLGVIEFVPFKEVTTEEYNRIGNKQKANIETILAWGTDITYIDKSRLDHYSIPCPFDFKRKLQITYDDANRKVIIPYRQVISCQ